MLFLENLSTLVLLESLNLKSNLISAVEDFEELVEVDSRVVVL
jgi:hypothetical protein